MSQRDDELRRRMLNLARLREQDHQGGYVPATIFVAQVRDDQGNRIESDDQAEQLLNDLIEWGVLELARDPHHQAGVKREFRHKRYRITTKGWSLWMRDIPPIPGIADDRVEGV